LWFIGCPHYDTEKERRLSLIDILSKYQGVRITLTDCSAIEVVKLKVIFYLYFILFINFVT